MKKLLSPRRNTKMLKATDMEFRKKQEKLWKT